MGIIELTINDLSHMKVYHFNKESEIYLQIKKLINMIEDRKQKLIDDIKEKQKQEFNDQMFNNNNRSHNEHYDYNND